MKWTTVCDTDGNNLYPGLFVRLSTTSSTHSSEGKETNIILYKFKDSFPEKKLSIEI